MATNLSFSDTGFFSKIAVDYREAREEMRPFYLHDVSLDGVNAAIENRKQFAQNRQILHDELRLQYQGIELTEKENLHIDLLKSNTTFTITTAHQPNIFTGPLYMMYKILHVIQLSIYLKKEFPQYDFVPVYYMGSEDADLDEIGQFTVDGKKYVWETKQTGAVGRMIVDNDLRKILEQLKRQIDVNPFGKELTEMFDRCYSLGKTIQQATLEIMHFLFGEMGLITLIPDNAALKKTFEPVIKKELLERFSHKIVTKTADALHKAGYKQQASGRDLNLFYLFEDHRERIEFAEGKYFVQSLNLEFSEAEILNELESYPERFSGNVILRGAFQETVLPNIIFVGGGGEIAYWLELKNVFASVNVPYPILLLRNSFALLNKIQTKRFASLELQPHWLFKPTFQILDELSIRKSGKHELNAEMDALKAIYLNIGQKAVASSSSLQKHVMALYTQAINKIQRLEKKIQKAERNKLIAEKERLEKLKEILFPHDSLQERVENVSSFYSVYGPTLLPQILEASPALNSQFVMLDLQ
ncbi:bacillithiol biosynthesis cysteine-adding enzyme BshC [Rhizosphaericola mali]|uniref:Putative cysteine ligase BshC n=1 Tax=Rhizosphaericola mali TaxID=2545455 RepID=A0A5P2G2K7_9BACT|nr:bacillithiol biosynthesis cysteine-adding enzyme BshC [Rhizosphaericola mali]QES89715.1 bacillithiol biosynthesis cysteine-adding enzyme BshC [Rhizosphaericola mali]